ncbi:hypothetical protein V4HA_00391 [Lactococcus cremoris]|nr:hypothetical protein [Lactococcus cremoris]
MKDGSSIRGEAQEEIERLKAQLKLSEEERNKPKEKEPVKTESKNGGNYGNEGDQMSHSEQMIENQFIQILSEKENQWTYRPDLKSEEALWQNFRSHLNRINLAVLEEQLLNVHLATSDCLVIACYLWGVLHFSETLKAKHQLAQSLFPNFLEYSRFVRRCNALLPSIQVIRQALVFKEVEGISVSIIDSFPIPLCQPIRNFRSKVLGDYANVML